MTQTPAGWYDCGQGFQRWWDGTAWTEHLQPLMAVPAQIAEDSAQSGAALIGSVAATQADGVQVSAAAANHTEHHTGLGMFGKSVQTAMEVIVATVTPSHCAESPYSTSHAAGSPSE